MKTHEGLINNFVKGEKFNHLEVLSCLYPIQGGFSYDAIIATEKSAKYALKKANEVYAYVRIIPIIKNKNGQVLFLIGSTILYGREVSKEENLEGIDKFIDLIKDEDVEILL